MPNITQYSDAYVYIYPHGYHMLYILFFLLILILAGISSGLTLGLLSFDLLKLKVLAEGKSTSEALYARSLLPILKNHHILLVALLLSNAACLELMPIILEQVATPTVTLIISVLSALIFAEILPQAIFKRYSLKLGFFMLPLIYLILIITTPIAWPFGLILNFCLRKSNEDLYNRSQLRKLIQMHGPQWLKFQKRGSDKLEMLSVVSSTDTNENAILVKNGIKKFSGPFYKSLWYSIISVFQYQEISPPILSKNEVSILNRVIHLHEVTIDTIAMSLEMFTSLSADESLNNALLAKISIASSSLILLHSGNDVSMIIGVLSPVLSLIREAYEPGLQLERILEGKKPSWFQEVLYIPRLTRIGELLLCFRTLKYREIRVAVILNCHSMWIQGRCTPYFLVDKKSKIFMENVYFQSQQFSDRRKNRPDVLGIVTFEDIMSRLMIDAP